MFSFKVRSEYVDAAKKWVNPMEDDILAISVYDRTYSRVREDGTVEAWYQTVERIVNGTISLQKDHITEQGLGWNEEKANRKAEKMYKEIFNMKWLPPGRGLWVMGTNVVHKKKLGMSLNNCFSGDTKFFAKCTDGDKLLKLEDAVGKSIKVLAKDGTWKDATVNSFGKQSVYDITFKPFGLRTNHSIIYRATRNHNWLLADGTMTDNIQINDIVSSKFDIDLTKIKEIPDNLNAFIHGIIYADGTRHTYYPKRHIIRLCGSKSKHKTLIENNTNHISTNYPYGEDPVITFISERNLKELPDNDSFEYKHAFFLGWLQFDGHKKSSGSYCLDTTSVEAKEWIFGHSGILGYSVTGSFTTNKDTNYGVRNNPLNRISITFKEYKYTCRDIEPVGEEQVYCVTEPDTHTFTLEGGIVTGNCAFVSTKDIVKDPIKPFLFLMDVSMLGTGVGFDTKGKNLVKLYKPFDDPENPAWEVPDNREGWVESVRKLLDSYFNQHSLAVKFDYSKIRKEGAPLVTFGGVSSGPEPLIELHQMLRGVLDKESTNVDANINGEHPTLSSTGIVDICNMIGKCVVSGNVRRTALIGIGDVNDKEFMNLKNYEVNPHRLPYGWTSNNSLYAEIGMNYKESEIDQRIADNGEPGLMFLDNARNYSRMCDPPDYKDSKAAGANPCFSIDTQIMTSDGLQKIEDLIGKPFVAIYDGKEYPSTDKGCFKTAENKQLYKLELDNGMTVRATGNHNFETPSGLVELKDLKVGESEILLSDNTGYKWNSMDTPMFPGVSLFEEGYLLGHLIGEGTFNGLSKGTKIPKAIISMWIHKDRYSKPEDYEPFNYIQSILHKLPHRSNKNFKGLKLAKETDACWEVRGNMMAINRLAESYGITPREKKIPETASYDFTKGMLQALFDTDGTVCKNSVADKGVTIRFTQNDINRLETIQKLLFSIGIGSKIFMNRRKEGERLMPDGKGGSKLYKCKAVHEVIISRDNLLKFNEYIGFKDNFKLTKFKEFMSTYTRDLYKYNFISKVKAISLDEIENVYCCTIPNLHRITVNGGLKALQCVEQTLESYEVCCLVETFPARHDTLDEYLESLKSAYMYAKTVTLVPLHWVESNRVVMRNRRIGCSMSGIANFLAKHSIEELREWCETSYNYIQELDKMYSDWLCVPRSIKTTSIKPSGTVSILANQAPGVHFPNSPYYYRRVRIGNTDRLIEGLKSKGYQIEPCVGCENTTSVVRVPRFVGKGVKTLQDVSMWEQFAMAAFMQRYWADNQVSCTITFDVKTEGPQIAAALDIYQYQLKGISLLPKFDTGNSNYPQLPYETITEEQYNEELLAIEKRKKEYTTVVKDIDTGSAPPAKDADAMPDAVQFCDGEKCLL